MSATPTLVILAAGAGSRFGGPKQLAAIGPTGETLLEYAAFDACRAGFGRVVLVVRPENEGAFRRRLDATMARRVPVTYVHQRLNEPSVAGVPSNRTRPWGTGHAVLSAEAAIDGIFASVNADDFYGRESYAALAHFLREAGETTDLAVVGFPVAETLTDAGPVSRALLAVDDEARLIHILELIEVWREGVRIVYRDSDGRRLELSDDAMVSMNMWGFSLELLPELRRHFLGFAQRAGDTLHGEFRLPDVIQELVYEGRFRVRVLPSGGEWCGLTYHGDLERVQSIVSSHIERGDYPEELWA